MTKLKLNLAQGAGEILTREELKKVLGGTTYGSDGCQTGTHAVRCLTNYYGSSGEFDEDLASLGYVCATDGYVAERLLWNHLESVGLGDVVASINCHTDDLGID